MTNDHALSAYTRSARAENFIPEKADAPSRDIAADPKAEPKVHPKRTQDSSEALRRRLINRRTGPSSLETAPSLHSSPPGRSPSQMSPRHPRLAWPEPEHSAISVTLPAETQLSADATRLMSRNIPAAKSPPEIQESLLQTPRPRFAAYRAATGSRGTATRNSAVQLPLRVSGWPSN